MGLVRFSEAPGKGCGMILSEESASGAVICGNESIHGTKLEPKYYLCPECYLRSIYSEDAASAA